MTTGEWALPASADSTTLFFGVGGLCEQGFPAEARSSTPTTLDHLGGSNVIGSLPWNGEAGELASERCDVRKAAETGCCWL